MEQLEVRRSFGGVRTALLVLGIMGVVSAEVRLGGLFQHTATKVTPTPSVARSISVVLSADVLTPPHRLNNFVLSSR